MRRSFSRLIASMSSPLKRTSPVISKFLSRRPRTALQLMDLPEPDSPRIPRHRPGFTEKVTSLTMCADFLS